MNCVFTDSTSNTVHGIFKRTSSNYSESCNCINERQKRNAVNPFQHEGAFCVSTVLPFMCFKSSNAYMMNVYKGLYHFGMH